VLGVQKGIKSSYLCAYLEISKQTEGREKLSGKKVLRERQPQLERTPLRKKKELRLGKKGE